jgi:hypothetical protein
MAERRLGWLGPDREVCDASSPLFVLGFFCSFPLFFSLIAEKNTCRFGAMILDFFLLADTTNISIPKYTLMYM